MEAEPEFCRDILETRIKTVFREVLKISRDIPFTHVYRFTVGNADKDEVRFCYEQNIVLHYHINHARYSHTSNLLYQQTIYLLDKTYCCWF